MKCCLLPLLLLAACAQKDDSKPVTAGPMPYQVSYHLQGLEAAGATFTVDLSSTPAVDYSLTLTAANPQPGPFLGVPSGSSLTAGDKLTVTLAVPRQPVPLAANAALEATVAFAGQNQLLHLANGYLSNSANYGPNGAGQTVTIARP